MNTVSLSHEALEDLERTLTRDELTRQDSSHCQEMITLLKSEREDPTRFAQYANSEQTLIMSLIDRFEDFCQRHLSAARLKHERVIAGGTATF